MKVSGTASMTVSGTIAAAALAVAALTFPSPASAGYESPYSGAPFADAATSPPPSPDPPIRLAEIKPPIIPPPEKKAPFDGGYYLSKGWTMLNAKLFKRAAEMFTFAAGFEEVELEAKLGLSYALRNLERRGEAAALLVELVERDFRKEEVLPDLVGLLVAEKEFKLARKYARSLKGGDRRKWFHKIDTGELDLELKAALKAGNAGRLARILNDNGWAMESCRTPWQFFNAAKLILESGRLKEGTGAMKALLKGCPEVWDLRVAVFYTIKPYTTPGEMEELVAVEAARQGLPEDYRTKVAELELSLKRDALSKTDLTSPEALAVAIELLEANPGDEGLQVTVAWGLFNNGRYEEAVAAFDKLLAASPDNKDYALGRGYALDKLGGGTEAEEETGDEPAAPAEAAEVSAEEGTLASLAWKLYNEGWHEQALDTFDRLLEMDAGNIDYATGKAYSLVRLGRADEALAIAEEFALVDIKVEIFRGRLSKLDAATDEAAALARLILAAKQGDEGALAVLGWGHFNSGRTEDALEIFTGLHDKDPGSPDHALGLAFVLVKLGRTDEALALAEKFPDASSFDQIRTDVILTRANAAYESKDYDGAEGHLNKVLAADPSNAAANSLLVWVRFNQGRAEEVLPYFIKEYEDKGDPQSAAMLLMAYNKAGRDDEARRLAKELSGDDDKEIRKTAARYYNDRGWPLVAAQTENCDSECWYNALAARLTVDVIYSQKSGDEGTSLLDVLSVPLTLDLPFSTGKKVTFSVKTESLDSGTAPASPFVGNFYLGGAPVNELITSTTVMTPNIIIEKDGGQGYTLMLGTTPIGGAVAATITGRVQYGPGPWIVRLHRLPVRESILSYTGLDDPYTEASFGRVTKTGFELEANGSPAADWWASLRGGFDYYDGVNVVDNSAVHATLAMGKASKFDASELSLGFFLSAMSYDKNSNHYTYGHGGYFSPGLFYVGGPTLRYRTFLCEGFLGDLQMSVNYFHSETDTARRYPLSSDPAASSQIFEGDEDSGIGYSVGLEGLKLLTPNVAAGARTKFSESAEYSEWYAGLTLRYFFGGVKVLGGFD